MNEWLQINHAKHCPLPATFPPSFWQSPHTVMVPGSFFEALHESSNFRCRHLSGYADWPDPLQSNLTNLTSNSWTAQSLGNMARGVGLHTWTFLSRNL